MFSLQSTREFITNNDYLGNHSITFIGTTKRRNSLSNKDYLLALNQLLSTKEVELKVNLTEYEGTETFYQQRINKNFKDKLPRINEDYERAFEESLFTTL